MHKSKENKIPHLIVKVRNVPRIKISYLYASSVAQRETG
jgi:hypothetical protein